MARRQQIIYQSASGYTVTLELSHQPNGNILPPYTSVITFNDGEQVVTLTDNTIKLERMLRTMASALSNEEN